MARQRQLAPMAGKYKQGQGRGMKQQMGGTLLGLIVGILIGLGWERVDYFALLSLPFFIGAIAIWRLRATQLDPAS